MANVGVPEKIITIEPIKTPEPVKEPAPAQTMTDEDFRRLFVGQWPSAEGITGG